MMHVVDWFPTLLSATGVSNTLKDIDGVNQWPIIRDGVGKAPRTGFVYNFDSKDEKLFGAISSSGGLVDCLDPVLTPCEKVGGKDFTINQVESVFAHAEKLVCGNYKRGSASCKALPKLPALGPHDRKVASYIELIIEGVDAIAPSN
ncbi:hypothetical protein HPB50_021047 [Hyalomma asiaticum]|uniref:Uncharacterized protein n=1 Tax=Hyalomma asiaticum TaxID=266040 RepID=A0ACB7RUN9_HYAAI|nr:hypothetical protein HPB50_021047 [Hyalomma asiaticum]